MRDPLDYLSRDYLEELAQAGGRRYRGFEIYDRGDGYLVRFMLGRRLDGRDAEWRMDGWSFEKVLSECDSLWETPPLYEPDAELRFAHPDPDAPFGTPAKCWEWMREHPDRRPK